MMKRISKERWRGWKRGYVVFVEDVVKLEDLNAEGGCRKKI